MLGENFFVNMNQTLSKIPVLNSMMTYQNTPDEIFSQLKPLVVSVCVIIPIIVFLSIGLTVLFAKPCCPRCAMCCCSICSLFVGIFSLIFLLCSFPNSGVIQPIASKIETDLTGLMDPILKVIND